MLFRSQLPQLAVLRSFAQGIGVLRAERLQAQAIGFQRDRAWCVHQRLAERSAEAAKQIGALVKTIQTDTHDAVAAMEKSTQGVVEGAKLSDAAGTALQDISQVSNRLAELIQGISYATGMQATSANGVAHNMQHILQVTQQTQDGTQQTASSVRKLTSLAQELKNSVSRFRVGA